MYFSKREKTAFIVLSVLIFYGIQVSGLECHTCSDYDFDGEPTNSDTCFNAVASTSSAVCSNSDAYCLTRFNFQDGIATSISRSCTSGRNDHDSSTSYMPEDNKCETTLATSPYTYSYTQTIDSTTCYYHCNSSDNCNSVSGSTLKTCGSDCGRRNSRGYCNYISGKCVCRYNWIGIACSTKNTPYSGRKCVQCNSEIDKDCRTKTDGAFCPTSKQYCSSTQTSLFKAGSVMRTVLIRGCTASHIAVDECKFTDIYSDNGIRGQGYNEYTCYSTCDSDNCNTNTPNGRIDGGEKPLLKCHQCSGLGSDCTGLSVCPSGYTHCMTTLNYLISDDVDHRFKVDNPGSYKLLNIKRGCAKSSLTAECTNSTIGDLSLKIISCQETCQDDGCNDGWPTRPKCYQCSGTSTSSCFKSPDFVWKCSYPYQKYCVIKDNGLEEGTRATIEGYPRYIHRDCSYVDIGTNCNKKTIRGKEIQSCNYTCTTDGCNVGSGSKSFRQITHFALLFCVLSVARISV